MFKIIQNYESKTEPLFHQIDAIDYISKKPDVALFDEQGLGKTKIVIDSLCWSMKGNAIEGALVIAPMSLLYNWEDEVKKHSFLIPVVLKGNKSEKRYKYLTGANFYIINYESVVAETQRIKRFCKSRKVAIVLDESTRIKNPYTKTAKAIFQLSPLSKKNIIISGTPIANAPYDIWAQYYFLDRGKLLGDNYKEFKAKFNNNNESFQSNLNELRILLENNSIRRIKKDVLELPEKKYNLIYVNLSGKQFDLYEKLKKELYIEIQDIDGNIIIDNSNTILKKLLRLTQIASNPELIDKSYKETPAKFYKLDEILSDIISKDEKVLIWTNFVDNILALEKRYKYYCPLVIYGDISIKDRVKYVRSFQESDKNKVLILNPATAREGLTLTQANHSIYLDRNFNLVDYLQSQDRIHRISQKKICNIYKIIAKNTIDEYIENLVSVKSDMSDFVQGDVKSLNLEYYDFLTNKKELLKILGG